LLFASKEGTGGKDEIASRDKNDTMAGRPNDHEGRLEMASAGATLRRFDCPVAGFQQIINGKYKLRILWDLQHGPLRYGEIRKGLSGTIGTKDITPRVLSRELKTLTEMGLLRRKDYRVVPPKVEYALSAEARTLIPVIAAMHIWGVEHLVRRSTLRKAGIVPK
jgi:DNA-binding HxlR family transcriptional regulator